MGSGLQWIPDYNAGRTPGEHVQFAASAFMTGWEWPRRSNDLLMLKDGSSLEGKVARAFKKWKVTKADGTTLEIPDDQVAGRADGQMDEKLIKPSTLRFLKYGCIAIGSLLLIGRFHTVCAPSPDAAGQPAALTRGQPPQLLGPFST